MTGRDPAIGSAGPARSGLVLISLILVAAVANLNLAVANVALPDIGQAFDASQTQLNLVAVGYSLGLAASVLWLGALGDRYGRKLMLLLGVALSIPACLVAAWAPSIEVLIVPASLGGLSAGMAYPTTLALIAALWSGAGPHEVDRALVGARGCASPRSARWSPGALLEHFWWGSVFLITLPLAVVALVWPSSFVPAHVNETTEPVDNLGGILSVVLVGALILAINFAPVPDKGDAGRSASPSSRWPPRSPSSSASAVPGTRCTTCTSRPGAPSGSPRCAGHHRVRVADGRDVHRPAVPPERARLLDRRRRRRDPPAAFSWCCRAAVGEARRGPGRPLHAAARLRVLPARVPHDAGALGRGHSYWQVGLGYAFVGAGVGFAGTPASHSLTGSVPVTRAGMASGTADLQRDLGGAIMQSILGACSRPATPRPSARRSPARPTDRRSRDSIQAQLQKSFAGAENVAQQYPQYPTRSPPRRSRRSWTAPIGRTPPGSIAIVIGSCSCSSSSPGATGSRPSWPSTPRRTAPPEPVTV